MGRVRARKRNRHRDIKRSSKTKAFTKDLDQIALNILNPPVIDLDPDLPGLGQFPCIQCDVYYTCQKDLESHTRSKVHKRRVKALKNPYTLQESMAAAGLGVDNGIHSWSNICDNKFLKIILQMLSLIVAISLFEAVLSLTVSTWGSKVCHGVYGPVGTTLDNGSIKVQLINGPSQIIIYNILDLGNLKGADGNWIRCDDDMINRTECSNKGSVIISNVSSIAPVGSYFWSVSKSDPIDYAVVLTGMYCVEIVMQNDFSQELTVEFKNSYGKLPGSLYAAIPFYTTMTVVYSLICLAWFYGSYVYSRELLHIQKVISYALVFLVIEYFVNLQLFQAYNNNGDVSNTFLYVSSILTAARNSMSWFMLLIVALGYGVWRPSLGKAMYFCIALAVVNFIAGCAYSIYGLLGTDLDEVDALFITLPLSLTITLFYSFSLNALQITIKTLSTAKQNVKLEMYRSIVKILGLSVLMAIGVIVLNAVYIARRNDPDIYPYLWKWKWMMLDGLFHLIYFGVFCGIASLFRPTSNNQRYGMSEMLQDDLDDVEQYGLEVVHGLDGSDDDEDVMKWVQENVMISEKEEERLEDREEANEFEVRQLV